jgi:hypothetical protein
LANTVQRTIIHVDETFVDPLCDFDVTIHMSGSYKETGYRDASGFLFKTISTVGSGGPFTLTATAEGTTLTMQMQSFQEVRTFNPDGSLKSDSLHGIVYRFTAPGVGIVLLDAGRITFDSDGNVVFEAGPHQALHDDWEAFCAAFG